MDARRPKYFQSSNRVTRGFCGNCGTPLTFDIGRKDLIELAIGALDDPTVAAPAAQLNVETKLPFFDGLAALPVRQPSADYSVYIESIVSHQHPDHDTTDWPPAGGFPA